MTDIDAGAGVDSVNDAVDAKYGGTDQDSTGWTGFAYVRAGAWSAVTGEYLASASAGDQGAATAGDNLTIKDHIDAIGATKTAEIVLAHTGGGDTTTYTLSTSETIPANITLAVHPGAIISIAVGITLTVNGPLESGLHQAFSGDGTVVFGDGAISRLYPEWWGGGTDKSAAVNATAFQSAATAIINSGGKGTFKLSSGEYDLSTTITFALDVDCKWLTIEGEGASSRINWSGTGAAVHITKDGAGMNNFAGVIVRDFSISGGDSIVADRDGIIFGSASGQYFLTERVWFRYLDSGITLKSDSVVNYIQNVKIRNCNIGIECEAAANSNHIDSSGITSCGYGIKFHTSTNNTVRDCRLDSNDIAIYAYVATALIISGNRFEGNSDIGISLEGLDWTTNSIHSSTISGNYFSSSGNYDINLHRATRIIFSGNKSKSVQFINMGAGYIARTRRIILEHNDIEGITSNINWMLTEPKLYETRQVISPIMTLSGAGVRHVMAYLPSNGYATSIRVIYTSATSADAGVAIEVGTSADDDSIMSYTSEVSKAQWYVYEYAIPTSTISKYMTANTPITVRCVGGKVGTGAVVVVVNYELYSL